MYRCPLALGLALLAASAAGPALGHPGKRRLNLQQAQNQEEALWPPPVSQTEQQAMTDALRLCDRILRLRAELHREDFLLPLYDVQNILLELLETFRKQKFAVEYFQTRTEYEIAFQTRMLPPPGRSRNQQLAIIAAQKQVLSRVLQNRDLTGNALDRLRFEVLELVKEVTAPALPDLRLRAESDRSLHARLRNLEAPTPQPIVRDPEQRNLPLSTVEKRALANRLAEDQRSAHQLSRKLTDAAREEAREAEAGAEHEDEGSGAGQDKALRLQERMAARVRARAQREAQQKLMAEQRLAVELGPMTAAAAQAWEAEVAKREQARLALEAEDRRRQQALETERRQYWSLLRRIRAEEDAAADLQGPASAAIVPAPLATPGVVFRWHPEAEAEREALAVADQEAVAQVIAKVEATADGLKWKSSKALHNPQGLFELRPKGGLSPWRPLYMRLDRNVFLILSLARKEAFEQGVSRAMARSGDLFQLEAEAPEPENRP